MALYMQSTTINVTFVNRIFVRLTDISCFYWNWFVMIKPMQMSSIPVSSACASCYTTDRNSRARSGKWLNNWNSLRAMGSRQSLWWYRSIFTLPQELYGLQKISLIPCLCASALNKIEKNCFPSSTRFPWGSSLSECPLKGIYRWRRIIVQVHFAFSTNNKPVYYLRIIIIPIDQRFSNSSLFVQIL